MVNYQMNRIMLGIDEEDEMQEAAHKEYVETRANMDDFVDEDAQTMDEIHECPYCCGLGYNYDDEYDEEDDCEECNGTGFLY